MKKMVIIVLTLAFNSGITVAARAQTPSISGINNYDGSTPTANNYYWSIYGSNLSNRTGGTGTASSTVFAEYEVCDSYDCIWVDLFESGTSPGVPYWYESPSQINFYFTASNNYFYDQGQMAGEWYYQTSPGTAAVSVENSNNQQSSFSYLQYQP